mmetsp:Transcript_29990/g.26561  ORF Transcript_29990/g.26561 Transcript_29990/m.26561 type:complete len:265 (+) Transcript_29990:29-823(+)
MSQKSSEIISDLQREIHNKSNAKKTANSGYNFSDNLIPTMIAGSLSYIFTNTFLAPLERVKSILQTNIASNTPLKGKINSPLGVYVTICNDQGVLNFYRGNMANVYKYAVQNSARAYLYQRFKLQETKTSNFANNVAINTAISWILMTIAYPFDLAHTRMSTDMIKQGHKGRYTSVKDCFGKASNSDNFINSIQSNSTSLKAAKISDLYKGYGLSCAYTLPYAALALPLFDLFNKISIVDFSEIDKDSFYARFFNRFVPPTLVL